MSLIHAEYLKMSRRKLFPVMLLILGLLMLLTAVLFFVVLPAIPEFAGDSPVPNRPDAFVFGAQQVAGQAWWFAVILATTVLGGELSGTAWATALTRDSRKLNHVASRLLIFSAASWLAFLVGTALWAVVTFLAADGSGAPEMAEWLGLVWRFALIAVAWTSIGLGAVGITRSIGPAMGIALGFSFLDSILAPFLGPYEKVSLTAASNGMFDVGGDGPFSVFIPGADLSLIQTIVITLGWSMLGVVLTWWGLQRRDA
ncbi:MAG: hypothetical protein ACC742_16315 [Thermoanaerobaculales bacterium]